MDISEYIKRRGAADVAKALTDLGHPVTERAVTAWRYRQRKPLPDAAKLLIEMSGGALSYESIYNPPSPDAA